MTLSDSSVGADIYYTTDGNTPDDDSTDYSSEIYLSETTTLKAIAYKTGITESNVLSNTILYS